MIILIIIIAICVGIMIHLTYLDIRDNKTKYDKISFKESLDLTDLPIITFFIGNNKYNFMLDTGANLSIINSSILNKIPYENSNIKGIIYGLEGKEQTVNYVNVDLVYKNTSYKEQMQTVNMDSSFNKIKAESGVTLHGILGNQFFQKYKYILDFNELVAYSKGNK